MQKNGGFVMDAGIILGVVAFILFVGAIYLNIKQEDRDVKKFADAHAAILKEVELLTKKIENLNEDFDLCIEKSDKSVETNRQKINEVESLVHKVAVDAAKKETNQFPTRPIEVIIYRKSDLHKSNESIKKPNQQTKEGH
jgi:hypothetical protein